MVFKPTSKFSSTRGPYCPPHISYPAVRRIGTSNIQSPSANQSTSQTMGHKSDQGFPSTTQQLPLSSVANTSVPPPLPPRGEPALVHSESPSPPPYTETAEIHHSQPLSQTWTEQDPRSSSTQSLVPEQDTAGSGKRTLLLIWVHGFMGNETSFQSFPAHVHNNVTAKMEAAGSRATHQVHTKIYPRYKSKNKVEQARDSFIDW